MYNVHTDFGHCVLVYNIIYTLNLKTEKAICTIKSICEFRGQSCFSAAVAVAGHLRLDQKKEKRN